MYDVPKSKKLIKEYLNILYLKCKVLPNSVQYLEFKAIQEVFFSQNYKCNVALLCAYPLAIKEFLKENVSLIQNSGNFYIVDNFSDMENFSEIKKILCTNTCALFSFKEKEFNNVIEKSLGKIEFLYDLNFYQTKRFKLSGEIINGLDFLSWSRDMKSGNHLGTSSKKVKEYKVEMW